MKDDYAYKKLVVYIKAVDFVANALRIVKDDE